MSEAVIAKRYAEALFQLGQEKDLLENFSNHLRVVKQVFSDHERFMIMLEHPRMNDEKKKQLIDEAFQGFEPDVINLIKLLNERHRIAMTPLIIDQFIQIVNDVKGVAEVTVQSVRELTTEEKNELKNNFAKRFQKNAIELTNIVDPSILGGLHIRIGNTIIDGTISGKLHRIERSITSANK